MIATFGLYWGQLTRAHQLIACVAASEIQAAHPRVDETKGVSLGGWLSVQTDLLSGRIAAVADFGVKTVTVPPDARADEFNSMAHLCHILPGMLSLCDRNLMSLAYCSPATVVVTPRRTPSLRCITAIFTPDNTPNWAWRISTNTTSTTAATRCRSTRRSITSSGSSARR